ncbi:peptidoglycan recognition protein family protein [Corynebacterium lowii]|uniref:N-acetylmuramoyl-L-alanine amidase n=1 Tax=Corynebacterium lowii TaxID=1544413 RepID=A0A0Q0UIN0_9CORY|nr:N-acetylmuramoyl-L-alanine amidase [Corynebacterium lowii]KQB86139.1 N-acetylmuramoyl-L-alanine amidase [Corynebacterium lowii]MDP9852612.1 hypothetical protein [Corynebacterium lowii]
MHFSHIPLSRRQLGHAAFATSSLFLASRFASQPRALAATAATAATAVDKPKETALSLRFPGSTEHPAAQPTSVVFHRDSGAPITQLISPSAHCRDGDFPLCSELIALPEGTTSIETDLDVHLHHPREMAWTPLTPAQPIRTPEAEVTEDLHVISREQWGADESLMTWEQEFSAPVCLTVHHTYIPSGQEPEYQHDWAAAVRGIYRFHSTTDNGGRGWGDIGYHLLIDPTGAVYQGRSTGIAGRAVFAGIDAPDTTQTVTAGHVYQANTGNIGVCVIGDFDTYHPTPAALDSLVTVLSSLCTAMNLDPLSQVQYDNPASSVHRMQQAISGHRDWVPTSERKDCPGAHLWGMLPEIRQSVAEAVSTSS